MNCQACGAVLAHTSKVCPECGTVVDHAASIIEEAQPDLVELSTSTPQVRRRWFRAVMLGLVGLLVVALGFGGYLLFWPTQGWRSPHLLPVSMKDEPKLVWERPVVDGAFLPSPDGEYALYRPSGSSVGFTVMRVKDGVVMYSVDEDLRCLVATGIVCLSADRKSVRGYGFEGETPHFEVSLPSEAQFLYLVDDKVVLGYSEGGKLRAKAFRGRTEVVWETTLRCPALESGNLMYFGFQSQDGRWASINTGGCAEVFDLRSGESVLFSKTQQYLPMVGGIAAIQQGGSAELHDSLIDAAGEERIQRFAGQTIDSNGAVVNWARRSEGGLRILDESFNLRAEIQHPESPDDVPWVVASCDETLLTSSLGPNSRLVAWSFEGKLLWESKSVASAAFCAPDAYVVVADIDHRQVVIDPKTGEARNYEAQIVGLDRESGKQLWRKPLLSRSHVVATKHGLLVADGPTLSLYR